MLLAERQCYVRTGSRYLQEGRLELQLLPVGGDHDSRAALLTRLPETVRRQVIDPRQHPYPAAAFLLTHHDPSDTRRIPRFSVTHNNMNGYPSLRMLHCP